MLSKLRENCETCKWYGAGYGAGVWEIGLNTYDGYDGGGIYDDCPEYEPSDLYLGLVAVLKEGLVWLK
jgi:hypothetical protein